MKRSPDDVNGGARDVRSRSVDTTSKLFEKHFPVAIAQQFSHLVNGSEMPRNSIGKLRGTVLMRKCQSDRHESTAETLMRILDSDSTQSCARFTGSHD